MKIVFFLLMTTLTHASMVVTAQRISYSGKQVALEAAFDVIHNQSGYKFLYTEEMMQQAQPVDLNLQNATVEEALHQCFKDQPLEYTLKNSMVVVRRKDPVRSRLAEVAAVINGKVTDKGTDLPLIGVAVRVKNTSNGVITDVNGDFAIDAGANDTLVFSYIGYLTREIAVHSSTRIDVAMEDATMLLGEFVAVGYGTQRRELVSNAIGSMKIDDSNLRVAALSPVQLLQGRIAGVNMSLGSGNLGTRERVSIRGASSLSASNEPLYVVDGIPIMNSNGNLYDFGEAMSSLATLNLSDIESIDVLKDAASAAIYGSRATNGVILITTKSGKAGKTEVNVNLSTGVSSFANRNKVKYADSKLYIEQYNEGATNYNEQYGLEVGNPSYILPISNPHPTIPDTDWLGLILQDGKQYNASASFAGGTTKTRFYFGTAYNNQEGIVRTNKAEKISFTAKASHEMSQWLEVGANITGSYLKNNQVPGPNSGATILARATQKRPFDLPYKPNGDYYVGGTDDLAYHNPVQILNEEVSQIDNYRYLGSYYALLKFKKKFSFRTTYSNDLGYTYDYVYYNARHPYGLGTGRIVENNRFTYNNTIDNVFNYTDKFGDFDVTGMVGHSFQKITSRSSAVDVNGFPSPSFDVTGVASTIAGINGTLSESALDSYFGRASVSYKDTYVLNATLRTDGSSKFAPDVRWGVFPSVSAAWNMSNEKFFSDKLPGAEMRLRLSYGRTGNQEGIGNYASQPQMGGGLNYGYNVGIGVTAFGNDKLTWETADQLNAGFDLSVLNGRVSFLVDAYQKNTDNLLYNKPMPGTTGVTSTIVNIGSMRNRGLEFTVNTTATVRAVRWNSSFNIALNRNELTSLLGEDLIAIGANRALKVGEQVGVFYLYDKVGIYQYDGEVPLPQYEIGVRAGDVKWRDVDSNGIINDSDRVLMGSSNPKFSGGWSNTFSYKNFSLDIFLHYMYGNNTYSEWRQTSLARIGYLGGVLADEVSQRWTGPGSTTAHPRSINGAARSGFNTQNSDRFLEDGSFLRVRTVTLAYQFPSSVLDRLKMKSLRLYCQADNLLLFTPYSGYDPEVSNSMDASKYGVDIFSMPAPRTINFGVNVGL